MPACPGRSPTPGAQAPCGKEAIICFPRTAGRIKRQGRSLAKAAPRRVWLSTLKKEAPRAGNPGQEDAPSVASKSPLFGVRSPFGFLPGQILHSESGDRKKERELFSYPLNPNAIKTRALHFCGEVDPNPGVFNAGQNPLASNRPLGDRFGVLLLRSAPCGSVGPSDGASPGKTAFRRLKYGEARTPLGLVGGGSASWLAKIPASRSGLKSGLPPEWASPPSAAYGRQGGINWHVPGRKMMAKANSPGSLLARNRAFEKLRPVVGPNQGGADPLAEPRPQSGLGTRKCSQTREVVGSRDQTPYR